jgi:hypothetical protein
MSELRAKVLDGFIVLLRKWLRVDGDSRDLPTWPVPAETRFAACQSDTSVCQVIGAPLLYRVFAGLQAFAPAVVTIMDRLAFRFIRNKLKNRAIRIEVMVDKMDKMGTMRASQVALIAGAPFPAFPLDGSSIPCAVLKARWSTHTARSFCLVFPKA